jgi:hypothetical protein
MKTVHFLFTFSYKNNNPYLAGGPQTLGRALGYTQAAPFINTFTFSSLYNKQTLHFQIAGSSQAWVQPWAIPRLHFHESCSLSLYFFKQKHYHFRLLGTLNHCNLRTKWNMLYVSNVLGFSLLLTLQSQNAVKHVILFKRSGLFTSSSQCNPRTKWNTLYFSNVLGFSLLPHTAIPERSETCYMFQTFWVFDFFPTLQSQNEVKHVILFKRSGCLTSPSHRHPRTEWNMFYVWNVRGCSLLPHTTIPEWSEACYMFQTFWVFDFSSHCNPRTKRTMLYCSTVLGVWLLPHIAIPERSETCSCRALDDMCIYIYIAINICIHIYIYIYTYIYI